MYARGLRVAGATDPGCVRERNEDAVRWSAGAGVVLLADGMGGHNAGNVASAMAVDLLGGQLESLVVQAQGDPGEVLLGALMAVQEVNGEIFSASQRELNFAGMGTTLVAAVFAQDWLTVVHVGDSRLYRMRAGVLEQLTVDHSLMRELSEVAGPGERQAFETAGKHIITRALGIAAEVEADVQQQPLEPSDLYLLCSDGLSDLVEDEELAALAVGHGEPLTARAEALVALARERGGVDNISVILAEVPATEQ